MPLVKLLILMLAMSFAVATGAAASQQDAETLFDRISEKAESMAGRDYSPAGKDDIPDELADLDYQQYRDIRFRKDRALWKGESPFNIEFFHPGFLYREPVVIHEVVDGSVEPLSYDAGLFDYGDNEDLEGNLDQDLGFAGFRVHFPINREDYHDEVIAFLGASYFRMVGAGQSYGLSARGLAVNTAVNEGEEFPRFTEFWLVRPGPDADAMTFYALLDSESVTGAYRFELAPGADTALDVTARVFARRDIQKLGVAPLTSMFMYGENTVRFHDDYRPEVHDSDGLIMHTGEGEWIWRPLTNGRNLQVSTLTDRNPEGFGLAQRDRDFDHYLDTESRYQNRPSHWVSPRGGDWGKGAVELVEIPSGEETNDNVVAFWTPEKPFRAGQQRTYQYRLRTFGARLETEHLAAVRRTRIGWAAIPGSKDKPPRDVRQFIVDFGGGELESLEGSRPVEVDLSTTGGETRDATVQRLPGAEGWRAAFKLAPHGEKAVDMRMFLSLDGRRLTETWNYVWNPDLVE